MNKNYFVNTLFLFVSLITLSACSGTKSSDSDHHLTSSKPAKNDHHNTAQLNPAGGVANTGVAIRGRELIVDGRNYFIKGVCWNPVGRGGVHPDNLDFVGFSDIDIPKMAAMGFNTIRTYEAITDKATLDKLEKAGIKVINSIFSWGKSPIESVDNIIHAVGDHPAVIMWAIGNEWNYNGLYTDLSHEQSTTLINAVAKRVKQLDSTRPIATIYGELPSARLIASMPDIDIWGLNVYSGITFANRFERWKKLSDKPMFLGEYGADAYNARVNSVDLDSHKKAVVTLTQEIIDNSTVYADSVTLGGTIFSWADEWWKVKEGSVNVQDAGGHAPGGGPYPDYAFNEEYWGLVDIDRNPRPAALALKALYDSLKVKPAKD